MSDLPRYGEQISVPKRARAGAFSAVVLVVTSVAVALVLVATASDSSGPAAQSTTTADATAQAEGTAAELSATPGNDAGTAIELGEPSNVSLQVANTTSVSGAAGRLTDQLKTLGYVTLTPTNGIAGIAAATKIHYVNGFLLEARALASELGIDPEAAVFPMPTNPASEVSAFGEPNILILLGSDLAG